MSYAKLFPLRVEVYNNETGEKVDTKIVSNDYLLICNGNRYVKSHQVMGKTHMLAVAVMTPAEMAESIQRAEGGPASPADGARA